MAKFSIRCASRPLAVRVRVSRDTSMMLHGQSLDKECALRVVKCDTGLMLLCSCDVGVCVCVCVHVHGAETRARYIAHGLRDVSTPVYKTMHVEGGKM